MTKIKDKRLGTVYQIKTPTKPYVGATLNYVCGRWQDHIRRLQNNVHHNQELQDVFNKHGISKISFSILEDNIAPENLGEREESWAEVKNALTIPKTQYKIIKRKLIVDVLADLVAGITYREIAKKHNISIGTVSNINKRYNCP